MNLDNITFFKTEAGSKYVRLPDGRLRRWKSYHSNTGGEDMGLQSWSTQSIFVEPTYEFEANSLQYLIGRGNKVALSKDAEGKMFPMISDNNSWRPAKWKDAYTGFSKQNPDIADKVLFWKYIKEPTVGYHVVDFDLKGGERGTEIARYHFGSKVSEVSEFTDEDKKLFFPSLQENVHRIKQIMGILSEEDIIELNITDKKAVGYGVEHNVYKSIKYPNKLIKVGPDFIVNEWYYMFEENPDIFPKVYGMYPLKNREWIRKIGIKPFQQHNFFDESEYYYVVIEELDTNKFLNLWNRMNDVNKEVNDVNKPPSFLFYMINNPYKYEDNWDKLLNHTKDTTISNEVEMFYSLIKKLHEVKDDPDLHQGQFGFDSEGVIKTLDI